MRYIRNADLREWVKESLRKTIFQKAHALAIQTGCEVLVKLEDVLDTQESQYYATHILHKAYDNKQLHKSPIDILVSGETGLPLTKLIDRASQSYLASAVEDDDQSEAGSDWEELSPEGTASYQEDAHHLGAYAGKQDIPVICEQEDAEVREISDLPKFMNKDNKTNQTTVTLNVGDVKEANQETGRTRGGESLDVVISDSLPKGDITLSVTGKVDDHVVTSESSNIVACQSSSVTLTSSKDPSVPSMPVISPSIRPYQCGVCQKTFGSIQVLSRHAQTFHGMNRGMRYYCNICGQSYKMAQYLQAHVKMHDTVSVMPVLCQMCGMGYYSNAALRQHELTHTAAAPQTGSLALPPDISTLPHTLTGPPDISTLPHTLTGPPDVSTQSLPHILTSPPDVSTQSDVNPGHEFSNSTTMPTPLDMPIQSKPNPRLQLSQSSSALKPSVPPQQPSPLGSSKPSCPSTHSFPPASKRFESSNDPFPLGSKRFKSSNDDETKDNKDSYQEPKQYHCLVCGMAFEEGEQLEEHVMKKHMQSDKVPPATKSDKQLSDLPEGDDPMKDMEDKDETRVKEEVMSLSPPLQPTSQTSDQDIPGKSERSPAILPGLNTFYPPFGALDKGRLMMPPFSQPMSFPPLPPGGPQSTNPNITSVLEQALPGLLPGISLLSNPTQLPMAQAAASIAQSEGHPPMVSQDGRFTCDICGNSYKYNCTLKEHRLTHAQTPLFSCKICNQAFSRQRQLRDHMFRHSGAYPYHCKLCGKGFVRPSILRRHETDRHKQAWESMS